LKALAEATPYSSDVISGRRISMNGEFAILHKMTKFRDIVWM